MVGANPADEFGRRPLHESLRPPARDETMPPRQPIPARSCLHPAVRGRLLSAAAVVVFTALSVLMGSAVIAQARVDHGARRHAARRAHRADAARRQHSRSRRERTALSAPIRIAGLSSAAVASSSVPATVSGLREISYYPAQNPWGGMWFVWEPSVMNADLAKIAALGANTVRIFVQPATFGYPVPLSSYESELEEFLAMAASHGLKVQLTLFDLWNDYNDISGSKTWAADILTPLRGNTTIAAVELQNEIDPTYPQAMAWARTMLPIIRTDSGDPVTLSVSGWNSATPLQQLITGLDGVKPDFYDLHFYGTPQYMESTFKTAQQIADGTPLLIGETGYSTYVGNTSWDTSPMTYSQQETAQSYYFYFVETAAKEVGLPAVGIWTLNDFPALLDVDESEQNFGLYTVNGTAKPAAAEVKSLFTNW
jgi:hypothetical protein